MKNDANTLVMISGGIDSVAALKFVLAETEHRVRAHHVHIQTYEHRNRHKAEARALQEIVPYLKKTHRDFRYTESTVNFMDLGHSPWDMTTVKYMIGVIARAEKIDYFVTGTSTADYDTPEHTSFIEERTRVHHSQLIPSVLWPASPGPSPLPIQREWTKADNIRYLGADLMSQVWFCRQPVGKDFEACLKCDSCREAVVGLLQMIAHSLQQRA